MSHKAAAKRHRVALFSSAPDVARINLGTLRMHPTTFHTGLQGCIKVFRYARAPLDIDLWTGASAQR